MPSTIKVKFVGKNIRISFIGALFSWRKFAASCCASQEGGGRGGGGSIKAGGAGSVWNTGECVWGGGGAWGEGMPHTDVSRGH